MLISLLLRSDHAKNPDLPCWLLLITFPVLRLTARRQIRPIRQRPPKASGRGAHSNRRGSERCPRWNWRRVAIAVSHRSNVRFGFNAFSYGDTFVKDGVTYKGNLDLRSAQATYDMFLLKDFHVSPGCCSTTATRSAPTLRCRREELHAEQHQLCERRRRSHHGNRAS